MDKKEKQKSTTKQTATKTRNKPIIILIALLLITAIAFSMYAYAKYKTTLTGNGTAQVAKWSFKVNGQTQTIPDIDLATTMKKVNNVAENKIAPGTEGSFDLNLDATGSEVAIDYNIKLVVTEKPTNLRFYTDSSYTKEIASTDGVMNVSGVMSLEEIKTIQTKTIYWKWPYQTGTTENEVRENDKTDTIDSAKKVTMTITVTGTQRNPQDEQASNLINELKVGDTINYNPSGTYNWNKEYATSNDTGTQTLSSSTGESFNVNQWKVLSIDKNANKIEMVPATIPSGKVTLQGAQGYNNAVLLLNQACSSLYGNSSKGITARSIKEEDFAKVGGTKWINKRAAHSNAARYGNQYETPYTTNNYYPVMYKNEANHVIGTKTETGLRQSEQTDLIAKTDEGSTNGYLKATTSIQPYQTCYNTTDYATTSSLLDEYSNILLPNGSTTFYWVASRCVDAYSSHCDFMVCFVHAGFLRAGAVFYSGAGGDGFGRAVFPVVSLSSQILEKTADGTYNVK